MSKLLISKCCDKCKKNHATWLPFKKEFLACPCHQAPDKEECKCKGAITIRDIGDGFICERCEKPYVFPKSDKENNWSGELESIFKYFGTDREKNIKEMTKNLIISLLSTEREEAYETGYREGGSSTFQDWVVPLEEDYGLEVKEGENSYALLDKFKQKTKKEERESILEKIRQYKSFYNPIGDERNKGKHEALSDLEAYLEKK